MFGGKHQDATYWARLGEGAQGPIYDTPAAITVHWENRQELFVTSKGDEELSNAVVYADQELGVDGYLYLGTSVTVDPRDVNGAFRIRASLLIPDLRNVSNEYRAIL